MNQKGKFVTAALQQKNPNQAAVKEEDHELEQDCVRSNGSKDLGEITRKKKMKRIKTKKKLAKESSG